MCSSTKQQKRIVLNKIKHPLCPHKNRGNKQASPLNKAKKLSTKKRILVFDKFYLRRAKFQEISPLWQYRYINALYRFTVQDLLS